MNRLRPNNDCWICGRRLWGTWTEDATDAERNEIYRQVRNGICDEDQRARQLAALEYIAAAETVRVVTQMFADAGQTPPSGQQSVLTPMRDRMKAAEARCVELKMWPADRQPSPGRFRGNR